MPLTYKLAQLPAGHGYMSEKVELRFNSDEQRLKFKQLRTYLKGINAQTRDGVPVHSNASVLRWLVENL